MESLTETKLCSRCGSWRGPQPLEGFDKDSRSMDGRRSICKLCRREERLAKLKMPKNNHPPNGFQASPHGTPSVPAKHLSPNAKTALTRVLTGFWLAVLFIGGFGWSSMNGGFAFFDTAKIFSSNAAHVIAMIAASVLTLGTAITATWSVKFIQFHKAIPALLMIVIFVLIQSLNIIVNLTGVKKRLAMTHVKKAEASNQAGMATLQALKLDYQKVIDRYPPTNKRGEPVVWKQEITEIVKAAHDEIRKLNYEIKTRKMNNSNPKLKFDWRIVVAWLALPELCMLASILVFSLAFSSNKAVI